MANAVDILLRGTRAERRAFRINRKVAKSVDEFNAAVAEFTSRLVPELTAVATQKIAMDALARVVKKTPVDLGRARGNWQVGINSAPSAELDVEDKEQGKAPVQGAGSSSTIENGAVEINGAPPFSAIHIANNVDYVIWLEDGSSTQAPEGIVRTIVEELKAELG